MYRKPFGPLVLILSILYFQPALSQWELISPASGIMDIEPIENSWFAVGYDDYVLRSDDKGHSWDTIPGFSYADELHVANGKILVSGVYEGYYGLYTSEDTSRTWTKLASLQAPHSILFTDTCIVLLETKNPGIDGPIYYSHDQGQSWTTAAIEDLDLDEHWQMEHLNREGFATAYGKIYALFDHRVFISEDGGRSFKPQNDGLEGLNPDDYYESAIFNVDNHVYFIIKDQLFWLDGTGWKEKSLQLYYENGEDNWEAVNRNGAPQICAGRYPYMIGKTVTQFYYVLSYSIDGGATWYKFHEPGMNPGFHSSILIDGNYVYACFAEGFFRRSLSDATNHLLEQKEDSSELVSYYADSSSSIDLAYQFPGFLGSEEELQELLEEIGIDSEDLAAEAIEEFMNDRPGGYTDDDYSLMGNGSAFQDLFSASQPGACSYMGMPRWSLNMYNLKLKLRDVILHSQGLGPEVNLAINFLQQTDDSPGLFGKSWRFEYEYELRVDSEQVLVHTGKGNYLSFSDGSSVLPGASAFELPCRNNPHIKLQWTGSEWIMKKGEGKRSYHFAVTDGQRYLLSAIRDRFSNEINILYDANKRISGVRDASNRTFSLNYSGELCTSISSPDGRSCSFSYTSEALLSQTNDFDQVISTYTYDDKGNVSAVSIADKTSYFNYDYSNTQQGRISEIIDPAGRKTGYSSMMMDEENSLSTAILPGGQSTSWQYRNKQLVKYANPDGELKEISYTDNGAVERLKANDGSSTVFTYGPDGNISSKSHSSGSTTYYSYNSEGKLISQSDKNHDIIFSHTYTNAQITGTNLPNGGTISYSYYPGGLMKSATSPGGHKHSFIYDDFGNLTRYTNPEGNNMDFLYDPTGLRYLGKSDFKGNIVTATYTDNGKLEQITLPDDTRISYDNGCCTQNGLTDQNGNSHQVTRDDSNRILTKTDAEGITLDYHYDENGLLSETGTIHESRVKITYNKRGYVSAISDEDGKTTIERNQKGQVEQIIDKNQNATGFHYDEQNRLSGINDAAGNSTSFQYNQKDQLSVYTNARGQETTFSYNAGGKALGKVVNGSEYCSYAYNLDGQLISYSDSSGSTDMIRNSLGFVTQMDFPGNHTLRFAYDANGNVESITYPDGSTVSYKVNSRNFITSLSWDQEQISFDYDPAGNTLGENRTNGTHTSFTYNKNNTLLQLKHSNSDSIFMLEEASYESGQLRTITKKTTTGITHLPQRLQAYYNKLNQPVKSYIGNLEFYFDADGNQSSYSSNNSTQFRGSYLNDNLLHSAEFQGGSTLRMSWDAMRHPRKLVENGKQSFLYYDHRGRLMFECNADKEVEQIYIYRGKRLLARRDREGNSFYYHSNRHGNIVALSNEQGDILNAYTYNAYGEILGRTETVKDRFTFLGAFGVIQLFDDFFLAGPRIYNSRFGRFLQRDPMGIITGTNPYLYASNNPLRGIDPAGLEEQEATVNALDFDEGTDNSYGTAGGTTEIFHDNPYYESSTGEYIEAARKTAVEFSDHPVADLLPDCIGNPISWIKAGQKLSQKDVGGALYQFVPFNNTIDATLDYAKENKKRSNMNSFNMYDRNLRMMNNKSISCEM